MSIRSSESLSVVPVDFGASLATREAMEIAIVLLKEFGWRPGGEEYSSLCRYAGVGVECFSSDGEILLVSPSGFGAFLLPWEVEHFSEERPFDALVHLRGRKEMHVGMQVGASSLLTGNHLEMVKRIRSSLRAAQPRRNRRYMPESIFHYVMSVHFFSDSYGCREGDPRPEELETLLSVCLDPSSIKLEDSEPSRVSRDVPSSIPQSRKFSEDVRSVRLSDRSEVLASWSSVIVRGEIGREDSDLVMGLQVRTQISWLAAWVAQDFTTLLLNSRPRDISPRRVSWQKAEMNRLMALSNSRTTASESSKTRAVRESFEETSGLSEEWVLAQQSLSQASEYADLVASDIDHKRVTVLEIFLLSISVLSLAQLVIPTPISDLSSIGADLWRYVFLLILMAAGTTVVVMRRR